MESGNAEECNDSEIFMDMHHKSITLNDNIHIKFAHSPTIIGSHVQLKISEMGNINDDKAILFLNDVIQGYQNQQLHDLNKNAVLIF